MTRQIKYKGTGELRAHWCRRCENQYCYSRTGAGGARTSTVTVALVPAVREPALLQSHWCENQHCYSRTGARTSTVTVALVREPALLQSHWCRRWENQYCYSRTGARTSTVTVALVREPAPLQNSIGISKLSPLRWGLHWQQGTEPVRDRFKWLCKGKKQKLWCSRNGEPSQHYYRLLMLYGILLNLCI